MLQISTIQHWEQIYIFVLVPIAQYWNVFVSVPKQVTFSPYYCTLLKTSRLKTSLSFLKNVRVYHMAVFRITRGFVLRDYSYW